MNLFSALVILLSLSSCATPEIPNVEGCVDFGDDAFCVESLSFKERLIDRDHWRNMRVGRISFSATDIGKYKKFIEISCLNIQCDEEAIERATLFYLLLLTGESD